MAWLICAAPASRAADPQVERVSRNIALIQSGHARPGSVFFFTVAELNVWGRAKAAEVAPQGLRQARLELGNGTATAYALVDFLKLRHAAGVETNWLVAKLIEGEKPLKVMAGIQSAHGRATVHLTRVEIGGIVVTGAPLDFLIRTFFLPLYPDAKIDQPFELADGVDRIDVAPAGARIYIRK